MPTFNEQRGQGAFQPVLSEPAGGGPGGRTIPGPGLAAATTGLQGAGSLLNFFGSQPLPPDAASEELVANKADLEAELIGELSLIADAPIPGGVFRQAKDDIDRVASGYRQGRVSQQELNVRLASIVQRYVATDPRNSEKYRDLARSVLGITPSEQILADRVEDFEFEQTQQRQVQQNEANFAISRGAVVSDGNGGIDIAATALRGRELAQQQAAQDALRERLELQRLQLENARGRQLTQTERDNAEYQTALTNLAPLLDSRMGDLYESLRIFKQGTEGAQMSREEQLTQIANSLNVLRAEVNTVIGEVALQNALTPSTRQNLLNAYNSQIDAVTEMFTGDLSEFTNTERMLDAMDARTGRQVREAAPAINALRLAVGDEFASNIMTAAIRSNPELNTNLAEEASRATVQLLSPGVGVLNGTRDISDMSQTERASAVKLGMDTIDRLNRRPQALNEQQRTTLKNAYGNMLTAALNTSNIKDRARGVEQLSNARNLATLNILRANDTEYEQVGEQLRNANAQVFAETARRVQPDTTINQLVRGFANPLLGADTRARTFIPVYDARSGRIEIHSGRDNNFSRATERVPPGLARDVERLNENLDAIVQLRNFGDDALAAFTDRQLRQAFVMTTGVIGLTNEDSLEPLPDSLAGILGVQPDRLDPANAGDEREDQ